MQVLLRQASDYTVKTKEVSGLDATAMEPLKTNFYNCQNCPHKIGLELRFFCTFKSGAYKSLWQVA